MGYIENFSRLVFVTLLTVLLVSRVFVESQHQTFTIDNYTDKAMVEKYILNTTHDMAAITIQDCLAQCLEDCRCLSFQMCNTTKCQLCSSNKYRNPSALLRKPGCTNYVFESETHEGNNKQCESSFTTPIDCCVSSKPCSNGGTCLPRNTQNGSRRFKCKCPDNYTGYRCREPVFRSCRGYSDGNRTAGKYKVFDNNKVPYEVFCDFDNNSSMTWTLIQSYKLNYSKDAKSLYYDQAIEQDNHSWNRYRLSKARMESIQNDSTKWRATCQYQNQNCTDLVRGSNYKMDILKGNLSGCFEVEYINVLGYTCMSNCTVYFWQDYEDIMFHCFKEKGKIMKCEIPLKKIAGSYCSESQNSTTQIWFGGD